MALPGSSRTVSRLSRAHRLNRLADQMPTRDDGPCIEEILAQRLPVLDDRDRVRSWFVAGLAPDLPDASRVCCPRHGLRRAYSWLTSEGRDLDLIESANTCP